MQSTHRYGSAFNLECEESGRLDAVHKAYADRIKYETVTGNIPNTVMTDHILFTFPAAKSFASGKIKYVRCGLNGW